MKLESNTFYNNTQIAEWFGIHRVTFAKKRDKYLKELRNYYNYVIHKNKILIIEPLDPNVLEHEKPEETMKNYVEQNFEDYWTFDVLESASRVAARIYLNKPKIPGNFNTIYRYVRNIRIRDYCSRKSEKYPGAKEGEKGYCITTWAKMYNNFDPKQTVGSYEIGRKASKVYEEFTEEEKQWWKEKSEIYFNTGSLIDTFADLLDDNINLEDAWGYALTEADLTEDSFRNFIKVASKELGCHWIVRVSILFKDTETDQVILEKR